MCHQWLPATPILPTDGHVDALQIRKHVAVVEFQPVVRHAIVLRVHGTPTTSLHDIFRATILSRYAAPAWSGMCSAADRARLESPAALWQTTRVLCRRCADRGRPIRPRWWGLFSSRQNQLQPRSAAIPAWQDWHTVPASYRSHNVTY